MLFCFLRLSVLLIAWKGLSLKCPVMCYVYRASKKTIHSTFVDISAVHANF